MKIKNLFICLFLVFILGACSTKNDDINSYFENDDNIEVYLDSQDLTYESFETGYGLDENGGIEYMDVFIYSEYFSTASYEEIRDTLNTLVDNYNVDGQTIYFYGEYDNIFIEYDNETDILYVDGEEVKLD